MARRIDSIKYFLKINIKSYGLKSIILKYKFWSIVIIVSNQWLLWNLKSQSNYKSSNFIYL